MCNLCSDKLALTFGNISLSYKEEEFMEFKEALDKLDLRAYFSSYPLKKKVYIRTEKRNLFFTFSANEVLELRKLISEGFFKFGLYKRAGESN